MEMTETRRWRFKAPEMEGPVARWYARVRGTARQRKAYRKQAAQLIAGLPANGRVLEVAPGPGYLAIEMARLGAYVTGLDISKEAIALARQRGLSDTHVMDAQKLSFADERFDVVTASDVLEHLADAPLALIGYCGVQLAY